MHSSLGCSIQGGTDLAFICGWPSEPSRKLPSAEGAPAKGRLPLDLHAIPAITFCLGIKAWEVHCCHAMRCRWNETAEFAGDCLGRSLSCMQAGGRTAAVGPARWTAHVLGMQMHCLQGHIQQMGRSSLFAAGQACQHFCCLAWQWRLAHADSQYYWNIR